jgi:hypothetical protein
LNKKKSFSFMLDVHINQGGRDTPVNDRFFISSHLIPCATGGTVYKFPFTLQDVYQFRVRCFSSSVAVSSLGNCISISCPALLGGTRSNSQNGNTTYSIAMFPSFAYPTYFEQPIYSMMNRYAVNQLRFTFIDDAGNQITFPPGSFYFILDLWHQNQPPLY